MTTATVATLLEAALLGYALGAVPCGVLVTHLAGAPDVRTVGSGHTGGTNVVRATGRVWLGILSGALDVALATAAVLLANLLWPGQAWPAALAGAAAVAGHNWSAWIGFRGGVGLSSLLGMLAAHAPVAMLAVLPVAVAVWLGGRRLLRHDARSTALTVALVPPMLAIVGLAPPVIIGGLLGALAVIAREAGDWRREYRAGETFTEQFSGGAATAHGLPTVHRDGQVDSGPTGC